MNQIEGGFDWMSSNQDRYVCNLCKHGKTLSEQCSKGGTDNCVDKKSREYRLFEGRQNNMKDGYITL